MAPSSKNNPAPYLRLQKSWKDATVASFILLATWVRVLSLAMKTTHPIRKEHGFTLTNYDRQTTTIPTCSY